MNNLIEDAERAISISLTHWKREIDELEGASVTGIHADYVSHCLLAFRIDSVERLSTDLHDPTEMPITDYFLAQVTLAITPRPIVTMSMAEVRAQATDIEIVSRTYHVKHFVDHTWLVIYDL